MAFVFVLVVCLAVVCCLTPLAVYLVWLAQVNRRDRPTVVAGTWDFAGLLAGLSGFILFGGGLLVSLLQSNARFWMRGNFEAVRAAWTNEKLTWTLIALTYLGVVCGAAWLAFAGRRRTLVVYNVDPGHFEVVLTETFEHLGRPVERRGNLWVGGVPLLELEPFAAGRTVTLRWVSEDLPLFQEVERHLREAAPTISTGDNPSARWFVSAAAGCGILVAFCAVLLVSGFFPIR